ncbi:hypothetical protein V492_06139 [Pseudogymnoascus sp. VKM F-4246]|nr:hypothetical protein V492_06139 [Pseudogymnoascus sp. VKM F-4246]
MGAAPKQAESLRGRQAHKGEDPSVAGEQLLQPRGRGSRVCLPDLREPWLSLRLEPWGCTQAAAAAVTRI